MTHYIKTEAGVLVPFAPHITKRNYIEGEVNNRATMQGLYKLTVRRSDGSVKQETPWFENMILDAGLDHLGVSGAASNGGTQGFCEIGTGTSVPAANQTQLQSFSARVQTPISSGNYAQPTSPFFYTSWGTWRFPLGALNGNYTEIGIGWLANNLFSRALITPDGVTPAAITVLSDEQLDVSYSLRVYPPSEADWGAGSYDISGTSYDVFGRLVTAASHTNDGPLSVSSGLAPVPSSGGILRAFTGAASSITGVPTGGQPQATGYSAVAYSPGSLQRTATGTFGLADANIGGIRTVTVSPRGLGYSCQYQFTPAIPKDNTKTLALTFQCSWARR